MRQLDIREYEGRFIEQMWYVLSGAVQHELLRPIRDRPRPLIWPIKLLQEHPEKVMDLVDEAV